jgi:hypothetical protein
MTPHCPTHLCVEMVFAPAKYDPHPRKLKLNGPTINDALSYYAVIKARKGIYRCPVVNCGRVALADVEERPKRACPRCKEPSDAPKYRANNGDHMCSSCRRTLSGEWKRLREHRAALRAAGANQ